jgi:FixJ family two-component response regulator
MSVTLDVRLPGESGLDLHCELAAANRELQLSLSQGTATFRCRWKR